MANSHRREGAQSASTPQLIAIGEEAELMGAPSVFEGDSRVLSRLGLTPNSLKSLRASLRKRLKKTRL